MPLSFADLLSFYLVLEALVLIVSLAIGLIIGEAESIGGKIAIDLSGWLQWKVLMSL